MLRLFWIIAWLFCLGCSAAPDGQISRPTPADAIERISEKGPVRLTLRLAPKAPRLSDTVEFEIEVASANEVEVKLPAFGKSVGDFLVRDYRELVDAGSPAWPNVRRLLYQLEPVHAGAHLIRSIAVEFTDRRANSEARGETATIESEPIEVMVTSELGDKIPNLADLAPMVPPRPIDERSSWWWIVAIVALLAIALATFGLRRRKKLIVPEAPPLSPSEIANQALAALLAENLLDQMRFQEFYVRLTGIVRHYIEGTTGIHAPEQTTEEFLKAMRLSRRFAADQSVRLQDFLEAADMVKYAGQQPDAAQVELAVARAREFVQRRGSSSPTDGKRG